MVDFIGFHLHLASVESLLASFRDRNDEAKTTTLNWKWPRWPPFTTSSKQPFPLAIRKLGRLSRLTKQFNILNVIATFSSWENYIPLFQRVLLILFSDIQPFGSGPRLCPGRSLAIMEIKLAFHTLFQSFGIKALQPSENVLEQFAFTMSPVGFNVKIYKK